MVKFNSPSIRMWSKLGTRGTVGLALLEIAKDEKTLVLSADLTKTAGLERFRTKYPKKILNMGIAEQNMIGVAAGFAKEGFNPYVTTFANFAAMRSYEQVRLHLGYMKFNVKILGIGSGLSMAMFGNTHYGIEDLALMRAIPNMTIVSPADGMETVKLILESQNYEAPMYIRLTGGTDTPIVYKEDYHFEIGKAIELKSGKDFALVANGTVVANALKASEMLEELGYSVTVINMHTIKPLDEEILAKLIGNHSLIFTIEEHSILGGLGGAVAEYFSALNNSPKLIRLGLQDQFIKTASYHFMIERNNLHPEGIVKSVLKELE